MTGEGEGLRHPTAASDSSGGGSRTALLSQAGVSIWLDDLSRDQLDSGILSTLIATRDVVGVTTSATTFASAVAGTRAYDTQLRMLAEQGASVTDSVDTLIGTDIAHAATLLEPTFHRTRGLDGRVSIEVDPSFAYQAQRTVERAGYLWATINRPNIMIAIPATAEGIDAIAEAVASGISVNVTLLFNIDVYRLAIRAYLSGLERAHLAGRDLATIFSVASFFVSRVDSEVDGRLGNLETPDAAELRGTVGVANARLAYLVFQQEFATSRAQRLIGRGANVQRPLWASTRVKNTDLPDTFYVQELIARGTINAMPPATLDAFAEHGVVPSDTATSPYEEAVDTFRRLKTVGISYEKVTDKLLAEGVAQREASRRQLTNTVEEALELLRQGQTFDISECHVE